MRWIAALAALAFAAPAVAATPPPLEGVWRGTVGKEPVMVCLVDETYAPERGAYYYLSHQESIPLWLQDDRFTWKEDAPGDDNAGFTFQRTGRDKLTGTWSNGSKRLPVALTRVPYRPHDDVSACEERAFLEPRIVAPRLTEKPVKGEGFAGTLLTLDVGQGFRDVEISSFNIPDSEPGDEAINAALRKSLDPTDGNNDYIGCYSAALGSIGMDGVFGVSALPGLMTRDWLSVEQSEYTSCGGAHPNFGVSYRLFDRQSGGEVELARWLAPEGMVVQGPDETGWTDRQLTAPLKQIVLAKLPPDMDEDCRSAIAESDYWKAALTKVGIGFDPVLPHVATGCTGLIEVPWPELAPFLSAEGKAGMARMTP
ncbi:hypothetical protein [Novosphingobium sp.]|uniref:hypothetical protein n=1 Tax=Novosphingobium sp. TaxID=1874826 RepID=UPI0035B4828C